MSSAGSDIFSGLGDLFSGIVEGQGYQKAASYEKQNAQIEREATAVNVLRQQRAAYQSFGATTASLAGSGVMSNTADSLNLLREAHSNAALDRSLIELQGAINVNADLAKASEYDAEAAAKTGGGIFGFLGSVAGIFGL